MVTVLWTNLPLHHIQKKCTCVYVCWPYTCEGELVYNVHVNVHVHILCVGLCGHTHREPGKAAYRYIHVCTCTCIHQVHTCTCTCTCTVYTVHAHVYIKYTHVQCTLYMHMVTTENNTAHTQQLLTMLW